MAKSQYRTDDVSAELKGSAAARVRMIARMTGTTAEDVQRTAAWERDARSHADANDRVDHPPSDHGYAVRSFASRFDGYKPGMGSKAARKRYLERIRTAAAGNKAA